MYVCVFLCMRNRSRAGLEPSLRTPPRRLWRFWKANRGETATSYNLHPTRYSRLPGPREFKNPPRPAAGSLRSQPPSSQHAAAVSRSRAIALLVCDSQRSPVCVTLCPSEQARAERQTLPTLPTQRPPPRRCHPTPPPSPPAPPAWPPLLAPAVPHHIAHCPSRAPHARSCSVFARLTRSTCPTVSCFLASRGGNTAVAPRRRRVLCVRSACELRPTPLGVPLPMPARWLQAAP